MTQNRQRPYRVLVHLNENELKKLNDACRLSGFNREMYIRTLLDGYIPSEKPSEDFLEMVNQLRRIGNNINQLTFIAHKTNSIESSRLKDELFYLNQSIGDIREKVLLPRSIKQNNKE